MPSLYLVEQGSELSKEHLQLVVTKGDQVLAKVPCVKVDQVVVFGNVRLTTQAMKHLMGRGVDVVFLTADGQYCGRLVGPETGFGQIRQRQYRLAADPQFALELGRAIVGGKLANQRAFLMRQERRRLDVVLKGALEVLRECLGQVESAGSSESLMGIEGKGTRAYFGGLRAILKRDLGFAKRVRRPPTDPVNVLLSLGYTLLAQNVQSAIHVVGLDPYVGFYHGLRYNRPALALDLMEEFRTIIVDSVVVRCINGDLITEANFSNTSDPQRPILLDEEGKKRFIREYEARVAAKVQHPVSKEQLPYLRCFQVQARQIIGCLQSGKPHYKPMEVR